MLGMELSNAVLKRFQVDWRGGRLHRRMRREEIGDGGADVSIQQWQDAMHEGQSGA